MKPGEHEWREGVPPTVNTLGCMYLSREKGQEVVRVRTLCPRKGCGKSIAVAWCRPGAGPCPHCKKRVRWTAGVVS